MTAIPPEWSGFDQDALVAAVDLVCRSGAKEFEVGWTKDDVPVDDADWYAHAQYRGARVIVEHHSGPIEAAEALARRILIGGQCTHCKRTISLGDLKLDACRWTRRGDRWVRSCEASQ